MRRHDCPLCGRSGVLYSMVVCSPCWADLPVTLAENLWNAWRRRAIDQRTYQETLATALCWWRGGGTCD